jgi:hypothetical protein
MAAAEAAGANELMAMAAKYILAALSVLFLILTFARRAHAPQARTWLLIAVIFAIVSAWLFYQG